MVNDKLPDSTLHYVPFTLTGDLFPKILVRKDVEKRWYDDNGILNINVIDFLWDKELI